MKLKSTTVSIRKKARDLVTFFKTLPFLTFFLNNSLCCFKKSPDSAPYFRAKLTTKKFVWSKTIKDIGQNRQDIFCWTATHFKFSAFSKNGTISIKELKKTRNFADVSSVHQPVLKLSFNYLRNLVSTVFVLLQVL